MRWRSGAVTEPSPEGGSGVAAGVARVAGLSNQKKRGERERMVSSKFEGSLYQARNVIQRTDMR